MTDSLFDDNWLTQLASYHRLWVGYSGGLDSTVLLHCLARHPLLASKLSAIHIHHGLSSHADAWLYHCQAMCALFSIPMIVRHVKFEQGCNIEEHARKARYEAFVALMSENDGLVLAHHADDQAETLLLQLLRGAGVDGLAAMPAVKPLGFGELVRPFLHHSRDTLEAYADLHQLSWIDDDSNQDNAFSRNYLRHQVMPLLRERWPGVVTNVARTATHCQQAKINLHALAELDCAELVSKSTTLSLAALQTQDHARLANILRVWLTNNQVRQPSTQTFNRLIMEVIFANKDAVPYVEWDGVCVRRYQHTLYLLKTGGVSVPISRDWPEFPGPLKLEDRWLCATSVEQGLHVPTGSRVRVCFRQGGELFYWRGQTKTLKKLLQQWHVPPWLRDTVPLIYVNDELAAVAGFAVSDRFYGRALACTYQIEVH